MSLFEDTYKTIKKPSEGIFRDKGSKFVAYAYPFRDELFLKQIITDLKIQHPKARHHCWAYRLTSDRSVFRVNDDGEPSGTAGRPILNVLLANDLTNVLVVVVRYFGGTLLGVPGLIHAYKSVTQHALDSTDIVEQTVNDVYQVEFDYLHMNDVMRVIKQENATILSQHYDNSCVIRLEVRQLHVKETVLKLENIVSVVTTYIETI